MVAITAITVTRMAYVSMGTIASGVPKICLNIACIAPFQASAATKPNALVINVENLSNISLCNFFISSLKKDPSYSFMSFKTIE